MKKALITLVAAVIATTSLAQLTVVESGQIQIGDVPSVNTISSSATLNLWSLSNLGAQTTGGSITFGSGTACGINGDGGKGIMSLKADKGFEFISGTAKAGMSYSGVGNSLLFTSNLSAPSFITTSDARLKANIEAINDSYRGLLELTPVSYELIGAESSSREIVKE